MKIKKMLIFGLLVISSVLLVACGGEKGPAVINGPTETIIRTGSDFDELEGITAEDVGKGDVTEDIIVEGTVDASKSGEYTLTYKVEASDGTEGELVRVVKVKDVELIGLGDKNISFGGEGSSFDPKHGVSVIDPIKGTLRASTAEHEEHFEITGEVNREVLGDYELVYLIIIDDFTIEHIRVISVVDEPILSVPDSEDDFMLEVGSAFDPERGVTASRTVLEEDEDGNMVRVTKSATDLVRIDGTVNPEEPGTYTLTYKIEDPENPLEFLKDSNGDVVEVVKVVIVYIKVEIRGISPAQVTEGGEFDPMTGITGYDSLKGNVTEDIQVIGEVNLNRVGNYTLTYLLTGSEGITDTVVRNVTVVPPIEGLQEIVIMAGDVLELDPNAEGFKGTRQRERQLAQEAAEEKYNVEVIYKPYPDNAAWGPDRINALIQASTAGEPLADIFYHVTTDWLGQLAQGGAIAPIDNFIGEGQPGEVVEQKFIDAGNYAGNHFAFSAGALNLESGLYFNVDLLDELGIPNPASLYLDDGEPENIGKNWKWTDFKAWAINAQSILANKGEDYYALGGALAYYGENLVPLNGGEFLDMSTGDILFNSQQAMETYDFIHEVFEAEVFEQGRSYDQGSAEWQGGKVLMHPGDLWFVKAPNRWGNLGFDLGFVPYPMADGYEGEYLSPVYGSSVSYLSSGHTQDKNELAFKVWTELQLWESDLSPEEAFRVSLEDKFNDELYLDVYMTVYNNTYVEFLNSIGVSAYSSNSLKLALNGGIPEGDYRSRIDAIVPVYESILGQYLRTGE